ncbi:6-phospho-beta-glucosidase [Catelliglobosispora koreensis]|uniref:6-phospho-beta-glucosidase n=1 Tax=Catelliglobosispora koreensis TaxID=129052 RepID=UPI000370515A|nr:6-phospho-beta-glucosidase [Catelliglobosispora koreensis]
MKIAVVGGGSTYTPELIDGFGKFGQLAEVALIDPAQERLAIVGGFAQRLLRDHPAKVTMTSNVDEGLDGADVVIIQLRVGGQAARISDETFPLECDCIGQETTGAGGLAKALRTVPVVLDIAERAARLANNAWIVNFTNPVGIVTRALLDAGHKAAGLCNVAIGFERRFAAALNVSPEEVTLDHVGLNHLTWEQAVYVNGHDRLPELLAPAAELVQLPLSLLERLSSVPSYYLKYFYEHDEVLKEQRTAPSRGEKVAAIESQLLEMYQDPALTQKPELLGQRGGAFYSEAAVGLIESLTNGDNRVHAVNVRNNGFWDFLADDAVIEVSCQVNAEGAKPLRALPIKPELKGLIANVSAYEELAVDAAINGSWDKVYRALLAHPLIAQHEKAEQLTGKLAAANSAYLAWAK